RALRPSRRQGPRRRDRRRRIPHPAADSGDRRERAVPAAPRRTPSGTTGGERAMIVTAKSLSRRTVLRGIGTTIALPFLDAMVPAFARAAEAPVRLAWFYVPNGIDMR